MLSSCLSFCQKQPGCAYKRFANKKSMYSKSSKNDSAITITIIKVNCVNKLKIKRRFVGYLMLTNPT